MAKHGTGKIEKECKFCKNIFISFKCHQSIFCSVNCQRNGREKRPKIYDEYKCKECNKDCKRRKGAGGTKTFCSIQCMSIHRGKQMSGENHPNWKGGISYRPHKSRYEIKLKKKQIGKCEICGSKENLEGHHVNGFKNDQKTIQILCFECHAKQHPKQSQFIRLKYARFSRNS